MSATSSNMSNNTNSQRMKRAVEILKKTQGKTPFKRSGPPKKPTKYARSLEEQRKVKQAKKNLENRAAVRRMVSGIISRLQAQNTAGMTRQELRNAARKALNEQQPVYNFEKQRKAMREFKQLMNAKPAPEFPPGMGFSPKRRRVNNNKTNTKRRRVNNNNKTNTKRRRVNNKNSNKTSPRNTPIGRLNSNFAPIVRNNNNRNANANVNVFRNKSGIVRVRRTSNNVHGTKNRWKHKLKTGSTSNNNLKNKHGNKNWHRHRPRGRYTSTTRCEFIAPKDALLRLASERGIQVNSKLSKAQICERLVNGS